MKRWIGWSLLICAPGISAGDLTLHLHGHSLDGKTLHIALHSLASDFPVRNDRALQKTVVASGDKATLTFKDILAGEYAVAVFADMNGNGVLDSNFLGIPSEPVGVSRDAKGKFGPPKFSDAAFTLNDQPVTLKIEVK